MGRPRKNPEAEAIEQDAGLQTAIQENPVVPDVVYEKDDGYNIEIVDDENAPMDVFQIPNPDADFEYRGIYYTKEDNLFKKTTNMLHQHGGWQLCPREHLLKIGYKQQEIGPDGLLHRGDLVLARIPKELYERKQEVKRKRAAAPMDAIMRTIKKGDPNRSGFNVHPSMKGLQTKEQLNANFGKEE